MSLITERDFDTKTGQEKIVRTIHSLEQKVHSLEQKLHALTITSETLEHDMAELWQAGKRVK